MVEPAARRLVVASALRLHVAQRIGLRVADAATGDDLLALARALRPADDRLARVHGLTFDPGFPGVTAGPEEVAGGRRLVLACLARHAGEPVATVVTTLIPGREPRVATPPPQTGVPARWIRPEDGWRH